MPVEPVVRRTDTRTPMQVTVDLASLDVRTPAQKGVTENVSPRGARVVTTKPWQVNEPLDLRSLLGNFRSRARVVYCQQLGEGSFAVGLQLLAATGYWKSPR